jgi:phosphatidylglycerol:prolipoprotein diacylglycerol transferase
VRKKIHPWQLGDFIAPAVSFGYAIGRLGCFMNGCCYGRASAWGLEFPEIGDHVHRIPTQIYESAAGLAIGLFLIWLLPRRKFRGQVWWAYVSLYAVSRFIVEFWRDDPRGEYGPLMTSQWIALVMFPFGVAMYFYVRSRGPVPAPAVAVEKS